MSFSFLGFVLALGVSRGVQVKLVQLSLVLDLELRLHLGRRRLKVDTSKAMTLVSSATMVWAQLVSDTNVPESS